MIESDILEGFHFLGLGVETERLRLAALSDLRPRVEAPPIEVTTAPDTWQPPMEDSRAGLERDSQGG